MDPNTYFSTHAATTESAPVATKKLSRKKKTILVGTIAAVVAVPVAAYAAVQIFGFGSFTSAAAQEGTLTVLDPADFPVKLTPSLSPGATVAVEVPVKNPNDYAVKVTTLIIKKDSLQVSGGTAAQCKITVGESATNAPFPAQGSNPAVAGSKAITLETPVTLAAGAQQYISFPAALQQSAEATKFCGATATFAVAGSVGS